jgi:hypothetical protein
MIAANPLASNDLSLRPSAWRKQKLARSAKISYDFG